MGLFDIFKPAWTISKSVLMSNDEEKALRVVEKLTNQKKLAYAAKVAWCVKVRELAVNKLTDQTLLSDIAKYYFHLSTCLNAAEKLIDKNLAQDIYTDIAKHASGDEQSIFITAVEKLDDLRRQTLYGDIAKNDQFNFKSFYDEELEKLTDQAVLFDVAKNAKIPRMRVMATKKLTSQADLVVIAKNDECDVYEIDENYKEWHIPNADANKAAVEKLTDQVLLVDIAINAKNGDVRSCAFEKLTDSIQLSNVVINTKDGWMCRLAFQRLDDFHHPSQTTYTEIARKATDDWVREAAAKKLTDQNEDISFSVAAFQPAVTVPGFSKEDALIILEKYLADNKPQNMSSDETEMLKPLFLNLLMYFRNNAYLYAQTGKGFGDACDSCMRDITVNDFYFAGNYAKCVNCALRSIVSTLDWNYYLEHVVQGIGHVPNSIVLQAHSIQDKIIKRREALSRH